MIPKHGPDPSVHANAELAKICPYCNPERMVARLSGLPMPKAVIYHRDNDGTIRKKEGPF